MGGECLDFHFTFGCVGCAPGIPEASSIMPALSGARCTDVRLYTL